MNRQSLFIAFKPAALASLQCQLDDVAAQMSSCLGRHNVKADQVLAARVCFSDIANQMAEFRQHPLSRQLEAACMVSCVEQPMLDGAKLGLQLWVSKRDDLKKTRLDGGWLVETDEEVIVMQAVRFSAEETQGQDACRQTHMAFDRHIALLAEHGMNLRDHCQRTWIYVRDIDRHYAGVVKGRNEVFEIEGLTPQTHFIASTGIGGYGDNSESIVCMDFISVKNKRDAAHVVYLQAPEYLNPTIEYGVAFERGTALNLLGERYRLISGTASIDHRGRCLYRGDVLAQTERLFLNISKLLEADGAGLDDMCVMIVYLRDIADAAVVQPYIDAHYPDVPCLLVQARVCRPEWLIEVACIAKSPLKA
ncbi:MAG: Rid family hydrolase [Alloprevotella sp.]